MGRLAIISAKGLLPVELARAVPDALIVTLKGVAHDQSGPVHEHQFEKLGALFVDLKSEGVSEVVFAGAISRPNLDPAAFDDFMQATAPRLMVAFGAGDDALLRLVVSLFEENGLTVRGAHEILEITAKTGLIAGPAPDEVSLRDAARGADILSAMSSLDVGQGVVVAGGLCLGIETLQGTDAMLGFVADTPEHLRRAKGVFVKAPKAGQDLRVDMPAIGPDTIRNVAQAGLAGVALAEGRVLVLDREVTLKLAEDLGVFIYGLEGL
ncbi:MAG: UDP-2,3-diacylglucosamine diphosphatase LpxI [Cognatishimia sp.]|uniref:LpxI family protein n=1 Tax=Cognatishimia sp. TaxID=2211648 RepID=UPI003B8B7FBA